MLKFLSAHKYKFALGIIIFLAIFFRLWQITSIPPGLYPDEAMNGVDALDSLKTDSFSVFYPNNNGREGLVMWLDALAIKAFGVTPWALRLFPALAGVFAVFGLYFLLKELFNKKIALSGAFFMATGFWAVLFSRIGFRAGLMIPILTWSFYLLIKAFNKEKLVYFVLSGILFGLGFYTYLAYRFAPILALVVFLPCLIRLRSKKHWRGVLIFTAVVFIVALPLGIYFLKNPSEFFGRTAEVSVFSELSPFKVLAVNLGKTLGMFNFTGDYNWRHNFSGSPQLFWPVGIFFLLGVYLGARRFKFSEKFLFAWLLVFLFPVILSSEGLPHALRALALAPIAYAFAGIGLVGFYDGIQGYLDKSLKKRKFSAHEAQIKRLKKEIFVLALLSLFLISVFEFNKYFINWAYDPQVSDAYSENYVKEAGYLNKYPAQIKKYIIINDSGAITRGVPMPAMTSVYLTYNKGPVNYLRANEWNRVEQGNYETVVMPLQYDPMLLSNLRKKFPEAKTDVIDLNVFALIIPPVKSQSK